MFDVYLITPELPPDRIADATELALRPPVPPRVGVQLRQKHLGRAALAVVGRRLRELTRARGVPLILNGNPELALELDADGVHMPDGAPIAAARSRLGARAIIGASCHGAAALHRAASEGASFAVLSPLHAVAGKAPPLGLTRFAALVAAARLPVFALGGIDARSAPDALRAGACGLAVTRAIFESREPASDLRRLSALVAAHRASEAGSTDRDSIP